MSDFDLDRLGDVWRRQPDPAEMEKLQRTAAAVSRRARLAQIVDLGAAVAVAGVVVLLVLSNPQLNTFVLGAAAILILLFSVYRQRQLRAAELKSLTGSTEEMLDQSIERVVATRKRNLFGVISMVPGLAIGYLFASAADPHGGSERFATMVANAGFSRFFIPAVIVGILLATVIWLVRSIRASDRELERLRALRDAYAREDQISQAE
jgi:Flp pilus assembly protein TadB